MRKLAPLLALAAIAASPLPTFASDQANAIIQGQYQAVLGDCAACHTKAGGQPFAGGEPLETPFGKLVPPNITPDRDTGIGAWSEDDFHRMMKTGVGHNGIRLYPAMPYPAYTKMTDSDVSDLWSYLRTLQPVSNAVVANQLPFPFNIRLVMMGWNLVNFTQSDFKPDPNQSDEWNRGAYIVNGAGHCSTCHSPKNLLGADKSGAFLEGASLQGWYAPNITGHTEIGVGGWSQEELVTYLKTGVNAHSIASGPMSEAIEESTSQMTDPDLNAIAVYLKSVDGGSYVRPEPLKADDKRATIGQSIYHDTCAACHGMDGKGQSVLFPALAGSAVVQQPSAETLAHLVLAGSQAVHTPAAPTTPAMPSLAWRLNDQQVADVLTYIRNSWGNAAPPVTPDAVAAVRAEH
ncbi:MAG: cytochrome c [Allorhizobium sp.]